MKVVLNRSDLLKGISTVQSAVAAKNTMPILANVLLEARDKKLEFVATDLDMGIRCSVAAEVVEKGSITINAKKLSDIVRELPEASVDIEIDENQKMILVCQKSQFKVHGLPKDDFPILPEVKKEKTFKIKGSLIQEMIHKTIFAVSTDETRYVLNGVYFQVENEKLKMVATDGHRLAYIHKKLDGKGDGKANVIIPTKTLNELSKVVSDMAKGKDEKEETMVEVVTTENQIKFTVEGVEIVSRLIEGQFPNYEQVIPKESDKKIEVSTAELSAGTKRVAILTSEKSNSIRYQIKPGKISISSKTPDMGEAKEEIDANYKGEEISIAYNAKYVLDVLKNVGTDHVVVELTQPLSPGILKPKGDSDYLCVIMPMRV
ncbi:MAG TPA: DNA polymerase III subunit beta [bacterium]|nr:DNA polymerase III subunit beta [bacterium]